MRKWQYTVLPLVLLVLLGCTPKPEYLPTEETVHHVNWPTPLEVCSYSFEFKNVDNTAVVQIPYADWVKLTKCRERETNYILNLSSMVCFYRTDLEEVRCKTKGLKPDE